MRNSSIIAASLLTFSAMHPAQVTMDEIVGLLAAGVSSPEVHELLERRGPPTGIIEGDIQRVEEFGAGEALLAQLGRQLDIHRRLLELAEDFEVLRDPVAGVSLLHPRGWVVSPERSHDAWFLTVEREAARPAAWFQVPRLFVWVQRGTPMPRRAQPEIGRKIQQLVLARLSRAGMKPRKLHAGMGLLSGQPAPQHSLRAEVPELRFQGQLVLRSLVLPGGTVVCAGFTCAQWDLDATRAAFEELARTLEVRP